MAEERIIDDEYGRGVKLRKTENGYVDVTDELVEEAEDEQAEEISFAFPDEQAEDDEDLVGLSPEEAEALRQQKIEAAKKRKEEYDAMVAAGEAQLAAGAFAEAEKTFEQALQLDALATEASVGYWRAKTADFSEPDVLIEEYVEPGIESLTYDLGYEATEQIKERYRPVFERRYRELAAEEAPLSEEVFGKQERRRRILKGRRKKSLIAFSIAAIPFLICLVLTAVFGLKITSTPDNRYVPFTIAFGVAAFALLFVFIAFANKLLNACRIYKSNEKLTSTEAGEELFRIMEYKNLYGELLEIAEEEADAPLVRAESV